MDEHQGCKKIMLAGNHGCRVSYCETHQVAELEIGALSLRLDIEAFSTLNELLNESMQKIALVSKVKAEHESLFNRLGKAH